ncbi:MAG: hypothetical protein DSY77_02395 [Bacteroidetes bacterium]|nr:MAG: hypothetical protein DSY77_02395 [Bacteroidota bacterium]
MDEQEKRDQHKLRMDRVVRWDNYRINQFSYTNNLFIGLNLAFLGFFISQSGFKISCNCFLLTLQILTGLFLIASFLTGVITVLNRLKDFRKTAQLTKRKKKKFEHEHNIKSYSDIGTINSDIKTLDSEMKKYGPQTWGLLKWQICTFSTGTIIGVLYIIIEINACG